MTAPYIHTKIIPTSAFCGKSAKNLPTVRRRQNQNI
nr:MAG TPA: hypothetical protein [Caudoviricetes sp.]